VDEDVLGRTLISSCEVLEAFDDIEEELDGDILDDANILGELLELLLF